MNNTKPQASGTADTNIQDESTSKPTEIPGLGENYSRSITQTAATSTTDQEESFQDPETAFTFEMVSAAIPSTGDLQENFSRYPEIQSNKNMVNNQETCRRENSGIVLRKTNSTEQNPLQNIMTDSLEIPASEKVSISDHEMIDSIEIEKESLLEATTENQDVQMQKSLGQIVADSLENLDDWKTPLDSPTTIPSITTAPVEFHQALDTESIQSKPVSLRDILLGPPAAQPCMKELNPMPQNNANLNTNTDVVAEEKGALRSLIQSVTRAFVVDQADSNVVDSNKLICVHSEAINENSVNRNTGPKKAREEKTSDTHDITGQPEESRKRECNFAYDNVKKLKTDEVFQDVLTENTEVTGISNFDHQRNESDLPCTEEKDTQQNLKQDKETAGKSKAINKPDQTTRSIANERKGNEIANRTSTPAKQEYVSVGKRISELTTKENLDKIGGTIEEVTKLNSKSNDEDTDTCEFSAIIRQGRQEEIENDISVKSHKNNRTVTETGVMEQTKDESHTETRNNGRQPKDAEMLNTLEANKGQKLSEFQINNITKENNPSRVSTDATDNTIKGIPSIHWVEPTNVFEGHVDTYLKPKTEGVPGNSLSENGATSRNHQTLSPTYDTSQGSPTEEHLITKVESNEPKIIQVVKDQCTNMFGSHNEVEDITGKPFEVFDKQEMESAIDQIGKNIKHATESKINTEIAKTDENEIGKGAENDEIYRTTETSELEFLQHCEENTDECQVNFGLKETEDTYSVEGEPDGKYNQQNSPYNIKRDQVNEGGTDGNSEENCKILFGEQDIKEYRILDQQGQKSCAIQITVSGKELGDCSSATQEFSEVLFENKSTENISNHNTVNHMTGLREPEYLLDAGQSRDEEITATGVKMRTKPSKEEKLDQLTTESEVHEGIDHEKIKVDKDSATNFEEICTRISERKDAKEMDPVQGNVQNVLENEFEVREEEIVDVDNTIVRQEHKKNFTENSSKKLNRHTQEFIILEPRCEEDIRDNNKIIEKILEASEFETEKAPHAKINDDSQPEPRATNEDFSKVFNRLDTHEFEILERQCNEDHEYMNKMRVENILEELVSETKSIKGTSDCEQEKPCEFQTENVCSIGEGKQDFETINDREDTDGTTKKYYRLDTHEFENLERKCNESNLTSDDILKELAALNSNKCEVETRESTNEPPNQEHGETEKIIVKEKDSEQEKSIEVNKKRKDLENIEETNSVEIFQKLERENVELNNIFGGKETNNSQTEEKEDEHQIASGNPSDEKKKTVDLFDDSRPAQSERMHCAEVENEDTQIVADENDTDIIVEAKIRESVFEVNSEPINTDIDLTTRNVETEPVSIKATENVAKQQNDCSEASIENVNKAKNINKMEVRPNIRNKHDNPVPITLVNVSNNTKEYKDRDEELKIKVDLLQQEVSTIRKMSKQKDQCISTSRTEKTDSAEVVSRYRNLLQAYEEQIVQQAKDLEKLKMESERNVRHFTNTEMAFSDVFEKYERAKVVIEAYQKNEDVLLENIRNAEEQLLQIESKCLSMRQQYVDQIRRAQEQVEYERKKYKQDISNLQAQVKRLEIKASSLEISLKQKTDECQALAALCDDITGRNAT